jgi:hypothetical protein
MPVSRRRYRRDTDQLHAQVRRLVDERDQARAERDAAQTAASTAARQFAEADAAARRLRLAAPRGVAAEVADLRRLLALSERARRALDGQRSELLAANEALCREAVDRAGTLAPPETARGHGGAA